jgi:hypothetical protein
MTSSDLNQGEASEHGPLLQCIPPGRPASGGAFKRKCLLRPSWAEARSAARNGYRLSLSGGLNPVLSYYERTGGTISTAYRRSSPRARTASAQAIVRLSPGRQAMIRHLWVTDHHARRANVLRREREGFGHGRIHLGRRVEEAGTSRPPGPTTAAASSRLVRAMVQAAGPSAHSVVGVGADDLGASWRMRSRPWPQSARSCSMDGAFRHFPSLNGGTAPHPADDQGGQAAQAGRGLQGPASAHGWLLWPYAHSGPCGISGRSGPGDGLG